MKLFGVSALSLALVPVLSTTVAFADTPSFGTRYEANVATENTLMAQARSYSYTNAQIANLSNTVATLNGQIAALYASEQVLVSLQGNAPLHAKQQWDAQLQALHQQRMQLIGEANQSWDDVNWFFHKEQHGHGKPHAEPKGWKLPADFAEAKSDWQTIYQELLACNQQIQMITRQEKLWTSAPYGDAVQSLQNVILKLQSIAISDTQVWISMEKSGSSPTTAFGAPMGLSISNLTITGWTLSWNNVSGATSYDVYLNGQLVATNVTGTSMSFAAKASGTTYTVGVRAVKASTNQESSVSSINVTTPAEQPISTPVIVAITGVTSDGWTLNWSASSGATGYNIYVNGQKVVANYHGTSYSFSGQNANQTYAIAVSAVNGTGQESSLSQSAQVQTLY